MARFRVLFLTILMALGLTQTSEAQTNQGPLIGAGVSVSLEDGAASPPYLTTGLSGVAPALDFIVGVSLARQVAVAFEASVAATYTANQEGRTSGGTAHFERAHRDTMFSGVFRLALGDRVAFVGGISRIRVEVDEVRTNDLNQLLPPRTEGPFVTSHTDWTTGAVLGIDYAATQWKSLAVVPTARAFIFDHHDCEDASTRFGFGSVVFRLGVRIESRF